MGAIRTKNVKARGKAGNHVKDFKKKKGKVGKKVLRSTVTKIDVSSKRIHLPLQSLLTSHNASDEKDLLDRITRQLQHYNGPLRTNALEDLKQLMINSTNAEKYIAMIVPQVIELLFDEDRDCRKACVTLMSALLSHHPSQSFTAVASIMITYICSGLTSIHIGIQRSALAILLSYSEFHSSLLHQYLEKLIDHVLHVLSDPAKACGQVSTNNNNDELNQLTKSNGSSTTTTPAKNSTPGKKTNGDDKNKNILFSVIQVLSALLSFGQKKSKFDDFEDKNNINHSDTEIMNLSYDSFDNNSVIILRSRSSSSRWFEQKKLNITNSNNTISLDINNTCSRLISESLCIKLFNFSKKIWNSITAESKPIGFESINILKEISMTVLILGSSFNKNYLSDYFNLVSIMFDGFPYKSYEATIARPGSTIEKTGKISAELLDLSLCEIALTKYCGNIDNINYKQYLYCHSVASKYLLDLLQIYVESNELSEKLMIEKEKRTEVYNNDVSNINFEKVNNEMDEDDDGDDDKEEEEEGDDKNNDRYTDGDDTDDDEDKDMRNNSLSDAKNSINTPVRSSSKLIVQGTPKGISDQNNLEIIQLDKVNKLFNALQAMAIGSSNSNIIMSESSLEKLFKCINQLFSMTSVNIIQQKIPRIIIKSALTCACKITCDSDLWCNGYPDNSLIQLSEIFSSSLNLLSKCPNELGYLSEMTFTSILHILRRVNNDNANNLLTLSNNIENLFKRSINNSNVSTLSSPSSSNGGSIFYIQSHAKLRYLLLDLYYHSQFEDVENATNTVAKCLSNYVIPHEERQYFIRLFYERRQDFDVDFFVELLFSSLQIHIISSSSIVQQESISVTSTSMERAYNISTYSWFANDISDALIWCSSAENPTKLLSFTLNFLQSLSSSLFDNKNKTKNSCKWTKNWLSCFMTSSSIFAIVNQLLLPCIVSIQLCDDDNNDIMQKNKSIGVIVEVCNYISELIICALGDATIIPDELLFSGVSQTSRVDLNNFSSYSPYLTPIISLILIQMPNINNEKTTNNNNNNNNNFIIFDKILINVSSQWNNYNNNHKERILKSLKIIVEHPKLIGIIISNRVNLINFVENLSFSKDNNTYSHLLTLQKDFLSSLQSFSYGDL
jgi:hypothetical protein